MTRPASKTRVLVECALMIALGTILGFIPVFELPHGGSITLVSTLPIVLVCTIAFIFAWRGLMQEEEPHHEADGTGL